jgi:hypothetical protein
VWSTARYRRPAFHQSTAYGTPAGYQQQPAKYAATDGIGISRLYAELP